jgi:hypothetical protein
MDGNISTNGILAAALSYYAWKVSKSKLVEVLVVTGSVGRLLHFPALFFGFRPLEVQPGFSRSSAEVQPKFSRDFNSTAKDDDGETFFCFLKAGKSVLGFCFGS